jgi:hypothetical protein
LDILVVGYVYITSAVRSTDWVPMTRFVTAWVWSRSKILARPKSEILGLISASSRMLLALRSRWTTLSSESSCRYCRPRAMPFMILCLRPQSSSSRCSASDENRS